MSRREVLLTPLDAELLSHLGRSTTLVRACRSLGITHDRGIYRLRRMARAVGAPIVRTSKGGRSHGATRLTPAGRSLLALGPGVALPHRRRADADVGFLWEGDWTPGPVPTVRVPGGPRLSVAFAAEPGERVRVAVDPSSVLLATGRFATSARNVLPGVVRSVRSRGPGAGGAQRSVTVAVGGRSVPVAVTSGAVRSLGLVPGRRVFLYVKATALRRVGP
ncbi:MAG TPA: TOBE domain-containing protein [Thermoplasmata archaeon]